jgi:hypothetical protein
MMELRLIEAFASHAGRGAIQGAGCGKNQTLRSDPELGGCGSLLFEPWPGPVFTGFPWLLAPVWKVLTGRLLRQKHQQRWMIRAFWRKLGIIRGFDFDPEQTFSYAERTS